VRVSGYSAYFDDLSEAVQDDLIARTANEFG
jgi:pyruvate-formate lyase